MSRRLDHRRQENRKVRRTATWRRKGIRECTTEATLRCSAMAGLPATRIEGLYRKRMRARIRATSPTAVPTQILQGRAIRSRQTRPRANKSQGWK